MGQDCPRRIPRLSIHYKRLYFATAGEKIIDGDRSFDARGLMMRSMKIHQSVESSGHG